MTTKQAKQLIAKGYQVKVNKNKIIITRGAK